MEIMIGGGGREEKDENYNILNGSSAPIFIDCRKEGG